MSDLKRSTAEVSLQEYYESRMRDETHPEINHRRHRSGGLRSGRSRGSSLLLLLLGVEGLSLSIDRSSLSSLTSSDGHLLDLLSQSSDGSSDGSNGSLSSDAQLSDLLRHGLDGRLSGLLSSSDDGLLGLLLLGLSSLPLDGGKVVEVEGDGREGRRDGIRGGEDGGEERVRLDVREVSGDGRSDVVFGRGLDGLQRRKKEVRRRRSDEGRHG